MRAGVRAAAEYLTQGLKDRGVAESKRLWTGMALSTLLRWVRQQSNPMQAVDAILSVVDCTTPERRWWALEELTGERL